MRSVKETSEPSLFGGLLRYIDCGFKMRYTEETHTYPKKAKSSIFPICKVATPEVESRLIIYLKPLSELVKDDIRHRAKRVLKDGHRVHRELLEQKD